MAEQSVIRAAGAEVPESQVRKPRGSSSGPLAEVGRDWERPVGSHPADPVPAGEGQRAKTDTLVELPDIGADGKQYRLVLEGDRLPTRAELDLMPEHSE